MLHIDNIYQRMLVGFDDTMWYESRVATRGDFMYKKQIHPDLLYLKYTGSR